VYSCASTHMYNTIKETKKKRRRRRARRRMTRKRVW
jgi:hypothetical protein